MEYILYSLLLIAFLVARDYLAKKRDPSSKNLPPGPWPLPVIGNLHLLLFGSRIPQRMFAQLALKHGPVMRLRLGGITVVVISSPEVVSEMVRRHDAGFAERPVTPTMEVFSYGRKDLIFAPPGPYATRMRRLCMQEVLSAQRVRSFGVIREEEVGKLLEDVRSAEGGLPFELGVKLRRVNNDIIVRVALGRERGAGQREKVLDFIDELVNHIYNDFNFADLFLTRIGRVARWTHSCHAKFDEILERIIHNSEQEDGDEEENESLVDTLLRLQKKEDLGFPFTTQHIMAVIFDVLVGATVTSAMSLEWAMAELVKNPCKLRKAQAEVRGAIGEIGKKIHEHDVRDLPYLKMVIKETFRLHPIAPLLAPRVCRETCTLGGYNVPAGSTVLINVWMMGRDGRYWDDPDVFMPERFETKAVEFKGKSPEFAPFGVGRKMCPGIGFAIPSMELQLASLLYHFDWSLPEGMDPEKLDMREKTATGGHMRVPLYVVAAAPRPAPSLT